MSMTRGLLASLSLSISLASGCGAQLGGGHGEVSAAFASGGAEATPRPHDPTIDTELVSPLDKRTAVQFVSVFPYDAGEALLPPATQIVQFLSAERSERGFGQQPLQVLPVTPPRGAVKAERLVAIAWGPRDSFSLARVKEVGAAAMREALRLDVEDMAYAPIARDQGVTTIDAADVAAAFIEGALREFLAAQRGGSAPRLKHITYEAGPTFIAAVENAIPRGVHAAHADADQAR